MLAFMLIVNVCCSSKQEHNDNVRIWLGVASCSSFPDETPISVFDLPAEQLGGTVGFIFTCLLPEIGRASCRARV